MSFSSAFFERRLQFIALHGPTASTSIVGFYTNDFVQNSKIMKVSRKCNFSFIFVLGKKSMNNPGIHNRLVDWLTLILVVLMNVFLLCCGKDQGKSVGSLNISK